MENHTNKTYQECMNQTATSKFGVIQPHLKAGIKLLDFGSGYSPEFIEQVQLEYCIEEDFEETDETYLPYLQKYFKMDEIPWPTKIIYVLKKTSKE